MKKLFAKKNKGFTLVEMMVSIFIFAIMMTSISGIFARQITSYKQTRIMANDLENAQFALNYIAKTLRTASILGKGTSNGGSSFLDVTTSPADWVNDFWSTPVDATNGPGLIIYDFSQEACIIFTFRDKNHDPDYAYPALWMETLTNTVPIDNIEACLLHDTWATASSDNKKDQRLTTGDVDGSFEVAPTRYRDIQNSRGTDAIGRATVSMEVIPAEYADDDHVSPVHIQSSVSLRDYPSDLSF